MRDLSAIKSAYGQSEGLNDRPTVSGEIALHLTNLLINFSVRPAHSRTGDDVVYDAIITTFPAATESDLLRLRSSNPSVVDCPALSGMLLSMDSSIVQQREKKSNTYTRVKLSYLDLDWRRASIIGQASSLHLTYGPRLDSHTASMTSSNAIHLTRLNSAFSPSKPASIYNMFCFCFFQHGTIG